MKKKSTVQKIAGGDGRHFAEVHRSFRCSRKKEGKRQWGWGKEKRSILRGPGG